MSKRRKYCDTMFSKVKQKFFNVCMWWEGRGGKIK